MFALILILILIALTIFTALLESFFTPEDLSKMGIHLGYSLACGSTGETSQLSTGMQPSLSVIP